MAMAAAFLSEDQFTCSICLEVFNNPVSTPCGHSFCQTCISSYWDGGGGGTRVYQCPLCKESFRKRPDLHINRTLKEITEQFKQAANAGIFPDGRGGGGQMEDPNSHPQAQSPPHHVFSPIQRTGEMPEGIFAEMMTRFQRLSSSGVPHTNLPHPGAPPTYSSSPVDITNGHNDPPPAYSPPRRYQKTLLEPISHNI